jgi:hypothetical protein
LEPYTESFFVAKHRNKTYLFVSAASEMGTDLNLESYPPEEWEINRTEDLASYAITEPVERLEGALLLSVARDGTIAGPSRFIVGGLDTLQIELNASEFLICGGASGYKLAWQTRPQDIAIRANSTTSGWYDITDRYYF